MVVVIPALGDGKIDVGTPYHCWLKLSNESIFPETPRILGTKAVTAGLHVGLT